MYACFLFIAVYVGYAFGSAPIVSFHYGAGNRAEVHNLYEKSLRLIAVVAVTLTAASMVIIPMWRGSSWLRPGAAGPDQPGLPAVRP